VVPARQGFLTGTVAKDQSFAANDIRSRFPRFTPEALAANQPVVDLVKEIAAHRRHPGQVALAWLLAKARTSSRSRHRKIDRLRENIAAVEVSCPTTSPTSTPLRTPRGRRRPRQRTRELRLSRGR
jgi:aryl-alcohol dehydrogenase-like predicted oxidoreductase